MWTAEFTVSRLKGYITVKKLTSLMLVTFELEMILEWFLIIRYLG